MANQKVKIFTLSTCVHCKNLKKFLTENSIEFDFIDVDLLKGKERDKTVADLDKVAGQRLFPTIVIGKSVIQGFRKSEIKEALGL